MTSLALSADELDAHAARYFWPNVHRTPTCWLWLGQQDADGYGRISLKGWDTRTHRYSLLLAGVPLPRGYHVAHTCDTPRCVRPDHLRVWPGSRNHADMVRKGRAAQKLASWQVLAIVEAGARAGYVAEVGSNRFAGLIGELARQHGVSRSQVSRILRAKTRRRAMH